MICNNCGKTVESGAVFCTNCGTKLEPVAAVTSEDSGTFAMPEQPAAVEFDNGGVYEKQVSASQAEEKTYFGKGALAFCLVVIGLLAISTGIFAGLYFSVV